MSNREEMADLSKGEFSAKPSLLRKILTTISALLLFSMMALTFSDVVGRYFLNSPIYGASEMIAFLMGLTIFTAFPLVTQDRVHITVSMIDHLFKGRVRYVQRLLVLFGTIGFLGFVTWLMFDQGYSMYESEFLSPYLDVPQAPIVLALSVLSGLATLIFIGVIWKYIKDGGDIKDQEEPESLA